jgi:hypothetical protein
MFPMYTYTYSVCEIPICHLLMMWLVTHFISTNSVFAPQVISTLSSDPQYTVSWAPIAFKKVSWSKNFHVICVNLNLASG